MRLISCGRKSANTPARGATDSNFKQPALVSSPGLTGRSSIQRRFVRMRDVTAYWMPRLTRGMTTEGTTTHSRRAFARGLLRTFRPLFRGRRECRVHAAPAVSCASCRENAHTSKQVQRRQSGIPCAMVLTVSFALSPVIGLVCHRRLRIESANLTPASRRQDHTTSPSASSTLVRSAVHVHRIPPRVRDDREPPLCGTGWPGI